MLGFSEVRPRGKYRLNLAILGGAAQCENVATANFKGCWGVQRSEAPPQMQIRPHHHWGAANYDIVAMLEGAAETD
eukprot:8138201-Pyramimonas_sp.AAC.1